MAQELSSIEIAPRYGCHSQTIINRLREYNIPVRDRASASAIAKIAYPRRDFSGDLVEKAYLLGFRQGDLHVNWVNEGGRMIRVECASTRREQIDLIRIKLPKPILWIKRGYTRQCNERQTTTRKDLWRLNIHRKQALLALFDLLAPYLRHAKRRQDMERARTNIEKRNCKQETKRKVKAV